MKLLSVLRPIIILTCAAQITPAWLRQRRLKAVIFDVDNTLVPQNAPATAEVVGYFNTLHEAGIKTFLLSNNSCPKRVEGFARLTGSDWLCRAKKPFGGGFRAALRRMQAEPRETLAVGDQLFTDIWGANRAGIVSALVEPLDLNHEPWTVRLKRLAEKPVRRRTGLPRLKSRRKSGV